MRVAWESIQPAHFDALIWLLLVLGLPWAFWRLKQDLQRPAEEVHDARHSSDS